MAKAEKLYRRLPGRGGSFISVLTSLWQGHDHLLLVNSTRFTENYKRFFYRDIQAIIVRRTRAWMIWNAVLGALTLLTALPMGVSLISVGMRGGGGWVSPGAFVSGIFAGVLLLVLLINLAYGPTCSVHVKTAVQVTALPSIRRQRMLRKVLARIKPLIDSAQAAAAPPPSPAESFAPTL